MLDLEFKKYPSITNSYSTSSINRIRQMFIGDDWVVLNKVHGANFAINTDGENILCAKRTSFINDDDHNFNNYKDVVSDIEPRLLDAAEWLKGYLEVSNDAIVTFFGELAGGQYDHPDVPRDPKATKVQKGVLYAPFNFFYLFDIMVDGKFINHDTMARVGIVFGITFAEALKRGTFEECLGHSNEYPDPIHKIFGLPEVEQDNVTEGIVIKPVTPHFFGNGKRVILKSKNDKFKENNGERKNKVPQIIEWSTEGAELCSILSTYISENRLRNIMSHGHIIGQKEFGKLLGLLNKDAWAEFMVDHESGINSLEAKEEKRIKKQMNNWSASLIRKHFQDIVEGEF